MQVGTIGTHLKKDLVVSMNKISTRQCLEQITGFYDVFIDCNWYRAIPASNIFEVCVPCFEFTKHPQNRDRGVGAIGWRNVPASGRLEVRIPAATNLSRKNR